MDTDSKARSDLQLTARLAGLSLLSILVLGIVGAMTIAPGIDVNLTGDIAATSINMGDAGDRLLALGWLRSAIFALELLFYVALWLVSRESAPLLAGWSATMGIASAVIGLLGAVIAMNAELIASNAAFGSDARDSLLALQATLDHTSFHLALVLGSLAKAGIFAIFLTAALTPRLLAGFGLIASLFVVVAVVGRDFIPVLGNDIVTAAFLVGNLLSLLALGVWLALKGVPAN